jgi:hypothetical protein
MPFLVRLYVLYINLHDGFQINLVWGLQTKICVANLIWSHADLLEL